MTTIQNATTRYFVRLPHGSAAIRCALLLLPLSLTPSLPHANLPEPMPR